ncbi:formimidoylglutamate deiminase [Hyphomonas sp.]|uniref:formimidoylglutamate deiminase n=1 Tax=Hyphomonas sp. TaxID=87 RepID=UPI0025BCA4BA|nr:formimidoylglutamate deiminase [Hyphomonas sp.]
MKISADQVLTSDGWREHVAITLDPSGRISAIEPCDAKFDQSVSVLLPAPGNVHSHSFQRAMAGLAERRGPNAHDDFWSWRKLMYKFLEILTPEDIEIIAAQVQMEMLEAGYAAQAEFHYLHHAVGGSAYDDIAETSLRHANAAELTGIGYTHLPVLYMQGGCDGRQLTGGQERFGCDLDQFSLIQSRFRERMREMPSDTVLGVAPHSLRAVPPQAFSEVVAGLPHGPIHIHAAEQVAEVEEIIAFLGRRPVDWLLTQMEVGQRWCMIHATQMTQDETRRLARSGAVAGVCPVTEANLGDGIFNCVDFVSEGGMFGIGSDSNVRIGLTEELRLLEVTQRLRDRRRTLLTNGDVRSNGRFLYEHAVAGSARALGRSSGKIAVGAYADMLALDGKSLELAGLVGDAMLDAWIFAGADDIITDVWSAGRHMVQGGQHVQRDQIVTAYAGLSKRLRGTL